MTGRVFCHGLGVAASLPSITMSEACTTVAAVPPPISADKQCLLRILSALGVQMPPSVASELSVSELRARCAEAVRKASQDGSLSMIRKGPPRKSSAPRRRGQPLGVPPSTPEEERQQFLRIISSMVEFFPQSTKLPRRVLRERVEKAVELSQSTSGLFGLSKVPKIERMQPWSGEELLAKGISRYERGPETVVEWGEMDCKIDPFNEVRTNISECFAFMYDLEMQDKFAVTEIDGDRLIKLKAGLFLWFRMEGIVVDALIDHRRI